MHPSNLSVVINDIHYVPPPRVRAMIARLVRDADEIAAMSSGKITFNIGGKTITPIYEIVTDKIETDS